MTHQLALIYRSLVISKDNGEEVAPHLMVNVSPVQYQYEVNNCSVFAIAFTLHKLLGDNLEDIEFDQCQMRDHLLDCLKKRNFSHFPTKLKCGYWSKHFPYREIELFCTCLMPETYGEMMIECDDVSHGFTPTVSAFHLPDSTEHWCCTSCNANSS